MGIDEGVVGVSADQRRGAVGGFWHRGCLKKDGMHPLARAFRPVPGVGLLLCLWLFPPSTASAAGIPWYEDGRLVEMVSLDRARSLGLTLLDLSDGWTSSLFGPGSSYRPVLQLLANERFGEGELWRHAREDRYFELYGIVPSPNVLRARLVDGVRHECHAALNRGDDERAGDPARALQAHLVCDGLLPPDGVDGKIGAASVAALAQYRRRHVVVAAGPLDDETRAALATDSRELDFRDLLRASRERVADASGLIEDGTARNAPGTVLGRRLARAPGRRSPAARARLSWAEHAPSCRDRPRR